MLDAIDELDMLIRFFDAGAKVIASERYCESEDFVESCPPFRRIADVLGHDQARRLMALRRIGVEYAAEDRGYAETIGSAFSKVIDVARQTDTALGDAIAWYRDEYPLVAMRAAPHTADLTDGGRSVAGFLSTTYPQLEAITEYLVWFRWAECRELVHAHRKRLAGVVRRWSL